MKASLQIKNGKYYAVISYKEREKYKQKWIALHMDAKNNKRKAEAKLEEIVQKHMDTFSNPSENMLFSNFLCKWLEDKKSSVEPTTWEGYETYVKAHLYPYFDEKKIKLRELTPQHIKEYYDYKYTSGRMDGKDGGLSIPSIKKHGIVIKDALNYAVLCGYITKNPAIGVRLPAKDKKITHIKFCNAEEANKILQAFTGHPLQPLIYVTLYYGLRRSEALGLKWDAVDFKKNTLSIQHTVVKNKSIFKRDTTKTSESKRTYVLLEDVRNVLLDLKTKKEKIKKEMGTAYNDNGYIFTWDDGTLFRPDYVTRGFQRVLKAHGIERMRFHDLRHSTASILYDMGWDMKDIQTWLRHSSINVTADIYTHISKDRNSKLANDLNSTFKI